MADEIRNIDLNFESNATQVQGDVDNLNQSIDKTTTSTDNQVASTNKSTNAFKSNANAVLENGGAMGLLNDLTGGYAMMVKDAVEASVLFISSKKADTVATEVQATATVTATVATENLTIAQRAFNLVAKANPYILLASLIASAAAATVYFVNKQEESSEQLNKTKLSVDKAAQSTKELGENIAEASSKSTVNNDIEILRARALGATTAEIRKLIKAQNDRAVSESIISRADAYNNAVKASNAYTEALISNDEEVIKKAKATYEAAQKLSDDAAKAVPVARDNQYKAELQAQIEQNAEIKVINDKKIADTKAANDKARDKELEAIKAAKEVETQLSLSFETPAEKENREYQEKKKVLEEGHKSTEELTRQHYKKLADIQIEETVKMEEGLAALKAIKKEQEIEEEDETVSKMQSDVDRLNQMRADQLEDSKNTDNAMSQYKLDLAFATGDAILAVNAATEGKSKQAQARSIKLQGVVNLAMIGANTASGIMNAIGTSSNVYEGAIKAAAIAVTGIAQTVANASNVSKALGALGGGGFSGGGSGGGGAASIAPNVSFVSSSENQVATTINRGQATQAPIKAYVVSSEMTTQQQLDRNVIDKTSI